MNLPQVRFRPLQQGQLWADSQKVRGRFGASVFVGDFFEEASAQLLDLQRLQTESSADLCPDHGEKNLFVECKACQWDRGVYLLYNAELTVYRWWLRSFRSQANPPKLYYTLWAYNLPAVGKYTWREELLDALAPTACQCVLLDFPTMLQLFKRRKQEVGDWSRYSGHGFRRIRVQQFRRIDHPSCWMLREGVELRNPIFSEQLWKGRIYNRDVGPVAVYTLVEGE